MFKKLISVMVAISIATPSFAAGLSQYQPYQAQPTIQNQPDNHRDRNRAIAAVAIIGVIALLASRHGDNENVDDSQMQGEVRPTAKCNDGTVSYSAHHSGTCSHHGGVMFWF